jgi:hypothetical protein
MGSDPGAVLPQPSEERFKAIFGVIAGKYEKAKK